MWVVWLRLGKRAEPRPFSLLRGEMAVVVLPVNDAPTFTLAPSTVTMDNLATEQEVVVTPDEMPADEASQGVMYTLTPDSVAWAQVSIDAASGRVRIAPVPGQMGTQVVYGDGG